MAAVKDEEKAQIALEILKELIKKDDITLLTDDHLYHLVKKSVFMAQALIIQCYQG